MKRVLWLCSVMAFMMMMVMGCSSEEKTKEEATNETSADVKSELLDFYLSIANKINRADGDLNTYEGTEDPTVLTDEDKQKAADSANAVVAALKDVKVPESLETYSKDFEEAIKSISDSYQEKAEQLLGTDEGTMDKANERFNEGSEKINQIFELEDLNAPDLSAEVNG